MIDQNSVDYRQIWYDENTGQVTSLRKKEEDSVRSYFETGDIHKYVKDEIYVDPQVATFFAPQHELEHLVNRVTVCWQWLLNNQGHLADKRIRTNSSLDEQFSYTASELFGKLGFFFPDDFFLEVFSYLYGEEYNSENDFPITFESINWTPSNVLHRDHICSSILLGLNEYIFSLPATNSPYRSYKRYKSLFRYFLSIFPKIRRQCFETRLYDQFHEIDGERSGFMVNQIRIRMFMAQMDGIVTKGQKKKAFDKPPINDRVFYEALKLELNSLDMPDEYYLLMDFLREHGTDGIQLSA